MNIQKINGGYQKIDSPRVYIGFLFRIEFLFAINASIGPCLSIC